MIISAKFHFQIHNERVSLEAYMMYDYTPVYNKICGSVTHTQSHQKTMSQHTHKFEDRQCESQSKTYAYFYHLRPPPNDPSFNNVVACVSIVSRAFREMCMKLTDYGFNIGFLKSGLLKKEHILMSYSTDTASHHRLQPQKCMVRMKYYLYGLS